uniref:Serine decarboxylase n=1 Tax=Leersia perrieri TaxID=77586 RepID=A0A0D9XHJ6_9ORYZ
MSHLAMLENPDQEVNSVMLVDGQLNYVAEKSATSSVYNRYEIDEPPEDRQADVERQLCTEKLLAQYRQHLQDKSSHHLGYPFNLELNVGPLQQFQNLHINNLGDPFIESNYGVHSRQFEVAVLDWFARLWDLPKDQCWGYVTNGGTEGNMHGLLVGRELFPEGIIYASRDSHYSIFKAAKMYRVQCIKIDTYSTGEMHYADFASQLLQNTGRPAIVNVNIGTTMKGAIDDLDEIIRILQDCGYEDKFYIHCDAALAGLMMPFIKHAPRVTFKKPIGSISVSGHKLMGCPMPCGVTINRSKDVTAVMSTNIEYVASRDATITGSRNGHAPIFLWYTLKSIGYKGICREVEMCIKNAQYLTSRLKKIGVSAFLNKASSTVVFEKPGDQAFVRKWQLACERSIAHVVVMPNVTTKMLRIFVQELAESRHAFLSRTEANIPCVAMDIGQENCLCSLHDVVVHHSRI